MLASGLLNLSWNVVLRRGFIFWSDTSFAMQMIGILLFLIKAFSAPIPPRSPADVPSTSSMMRTERSDRSDASPTCFCCKLALLDLFAFQISNCTYFAANKTIENRIIDTASELCLGGRRLSAGVERHSARIYRPQAISYFSYHSRSSL